MNLVLVHQQSEKILIYISHVSVVIFDVSKRYLCTMIGIIISNAVISGALTLL
jgi:hypothetical protein